MTKSYMLNSKTIHLVLLGVIVGATVAYVYSSYQANSLRQAEAAAILDAAGVGIGEAHPSVTEQEMLGLFAEALEFGPDDPELLSRYATYLFSIEQYAESVEWFQRLLELTPNDATMRTAFATALYGNGRVGDAIDEYQRALELDPEHTLALHNLVLAFLEPPRNVEAAASALGRLESIDPTYTALPTLRDRLRSARPGA